MRYLKKYNEGLFDFLFYQSSDDDISLGSILKLISDKKWLSKTTFNFKSRLSYIDSEIEYNFDNFSFHFFYRGYSTEVDLNIIKNGKKSLLKLKYRNLEKLIDVIKKDLTQVEVDFFNFCEFSDNSYKVDNVNKTIDLGDSSFHIHRIIDGELPFKVTNCRRMDAKHKSLKTFKNIPNSGNLDLSFNNIRTFEHFPINFDGRIELKHNPIYEVIMLIQQSVLIDPMDGCIKYPYGLSVEDWSKYSYYSRSNGKFNFAYLAELSNEYGVFSQDGSTIFEDRLLDVLYHFGMEPTKDFKGFDHFSINFSLRTKYKFM